MLLDTKSNNLSPWVVKKHFYWTKVDIEVAPEDYIAVVVVLAIYWASTKTFGMYDTSEYTAKV